MPPCSSGNVHVLGQCPGLLRLCVRPGAHLLDAIPRLDETGAPVDWPVGTTAYLRVLSGAFDEQYPAVVNGPMLEFDIAGTDTATWPRRACVAIWVSVPGEASPTVWLEGGLDGGCC